KCRPLPWGTLHSNGAPVAGHNAMHHRQAHTCPFTRVLGGEEGVEDTLHNLRCHPMTGIPDGQPHVWPCLEINGNDGTVRRHVKGRQECVDATAGVAHCMGRIGAEVEQHLVYLRWVGQYRSAVGGNDLLYSKS